MNSQLLLDVEAFLTETGMKPWNFGIDAVNNGRLVERLRLGRRVWPDTELQVRGFMIAHRRAAAPASATPRPAPSPPQQERAAS